MKIASRKTIPFITVIALPLSICSHADAENGPDDRYDDAPLAERFKLRIGGFLIDSFDTTARFDSTQYPIGTLIDLEEDFNIDASETVLRIDGFYRFNRKHRIDWTYYGSRRSGTSIASQEYVIGIPGGPDGGFIIPKDSSVQTTWDFDLLKVGYAWSFLNKRRYEMFIGAGLNIRRLDIEIDYQAAISTFSQQDRLDTTARYPYQLLLSVADGTLARNGRAYSGTNFSCLNSATSKATSRIFNYYSNIARSNMSASVPASTR